MTPCKLFLNKVFRFQALHSFNDMKIRNGFQFGMFWSVKIFLGNQHSFLEKVLIDSHSVCFWHKHDYAEMKIVKNNKKKVRILKINFLSFLLMGILCETDCVDIASYRFHLIHLTFSLIAKFKYFLRIIFYSKMNYFLFNFFVY